MHAYVCTFVSVVCVCRCDVMQYCCLHMHMYANYFAVPYMVCCCAVVYVVGCMFRLVQFSMLLFVVVCGLEVTALHQFEIVQKTSLSPNSSNQSLPSRGYCKTLSLQKNEYSLVEQYTKINEKINLMIRV